MAPDQLQREATQPLEEARVAPTQSAWSSAGARSCSDADGAFLTQRADDVKEVVRQRLRAYEEATEPLLQYYEDRDLHRIDGTPSAEEIHRAVERVLETHLASSTAGRQRP